MQLYLNCFKCIQLTASSCVSATMLRPSLHNLNFFYCFDHSPSRIDIFHEMRSIMRISVIFSREKQMRLVVFFCCYRRMFIVRFHGRARDMENSLFKYISAFSLMHTDIKNKSNVFKMRRTKRKKEKFFKFILFMAFIRRCYYS